MPLATCGTTRGLRRLPQRSSSRVPPDARWPATQQLVEQERAGGRRRPVDGSNRSGLGLGRRTARRGALRARTPTQHRRAAAHATRSSARGAQKLQTAPAGRTPGTQAARRSQALAPPARSDGAARTSAPVDRSGPCLSESLRRSARPLRARDHRDRLEQQSGRASVHARGFTLVTRASSSAPLPSHDRSATAGAPGRLDRVVRQARRARLS